MICIYIFTILNIIILFGVNIFKGKTPNISLLGVFYFFYVEKLIFTLQYKFKKKNLTQCTIWSSA